MTGVPKRENAFYTGNKRTLLSHKKLGCYSIESDRFPLPEREFDGVGVTSGVSLSLPPPLFL